MSLFSVSGNNQFSMIYGVLLLVFATTSWGGLLQVAKPLLDTVDPVWLNGIRYAISAPIFAVILICQEGRDSFCFDHYGIRLAVIGTIGFAGFGIVTMLGLQRTRPELAALIVAMMPLVTALVNWLRGGGRPSWFTVICMFIGITGVLLTASLGHPSRIFNGQIGSAPLLVFIGVACWAFYTQSAVIFPSWSSLRFTCLSCLASLPGFALIVILSTATGWTSIPQMTNVVDTGFRMVYIIAIATILAMLAWNNGIRKLGPLNGVLFINLVPISAFTISVIKGQHFSLLEWVGASLVCLSLIANNIYTKVQQGPSTEKAQRDEEMVESGSSAHMA